MGRGSTGPTGPTGAAEEAVAATGTTGPLTVVDGVTGRFEGAPPTQEQVSAEAKGEPRLTPEEREAERVAELNAINAMHHEDREAPRERLHLTTTPEPSGDFPTRAHELAHRSSAAQAAAITAARPVVEEEDDEADE